ncbi:MAG: SAM-dependent methyltransferase [Pseudomonadota bacterium]
MQRPALILPEPPPALAEFSTQLCNRIVNAMAPVGHLRFDQFMSMALYEPELGYYMNDRPKFGTAGDFVTAPEQGALFAQGLALGLGSVIPALPQHWVLVEAGPGTGALARDLLLALDAPPARYLMIEPSPRLRAQQRQTLAALPSALQQRVEWFDQPPSDSFEGVILANEVLDALPVQCFEWRVDGLYERVVEFRNGRFGWRCESPSNALQAAFKQRLDRPSLCWPDGYRSELCTRISDWMAALTRPLSRGVVLMVDYGYPRTEYYRAERDQGTLVAHYRHRAHFDPLAWPGLTDVSAFVDFTAVAEEGLALGFELLGFTSQAGFLLGSGLLDAVAAVQNSQPQLALSAEFKRLTLPDEMGERFKVMALGKQIRIDTSPFELSDQRHRL